MFFRRSGLSAALLLFFTGAPGAQTPEHVAAARAALDRSPVRAGTCGLVPEDFLGWPAALVRRCEYRVGEAPAIAYVLDVQPETLAKWGETACESDLKGFSGCYDIQLKCAAEKSGATFVIGGNLLMPRKGAAGAVTNMFYRNGVVIGAPHNGKTQAVPVEEQEKLAHLAEDTVDAMPERGAVALWRTMPHDFATKAMDLGVPSETNEPARRQKWLELIRTEMQAAMTKGENRLLAGWIHSHPITLRVNDCPDRSDP